MTSQKILPVTFQVDVKKLTLSKHHADPHNPQPAEPSIFFHKRGTPFFADRPPGSSYRPRRVESKGAAGISRQPITLRFVGYPTFPVGCAGFIVSYRLHTHNKKNMPTMGDVRHSLCRHPWQSCADSGATLPLSTSWPALRSLGYCFFTRGGEFCRSFYQCSLKRCFPTMDKICHHLCRRSSLFSAHPGATRELATSWAMPGTRRLFIFTQGGLFLAWKIPPFKKIREGQHMSDVGHGVAARGSLPPVPPQSA